MIYFLSGIKLSGTRVVKNGRPKKAKSKEELMCDEAVRNKLCMMLYVPDHLWMKEMCNDIMRTMPNAFHRIPDRFKT